MAKSSARYCSSRTAKRLPNCVSFTSSQKHAASGSEAVLSANALASPGEPAIAKLRCGRTTCWSPPAASIRRPALVWYRRSSTTVSGKISSANIGNWRCQRGPRETPLTATLRAIERYPRSHLDLRSERAQCDCNSAFARPPCLRGYDDARRNRLSVIKNSTKSPVWLKKRARKLVGHFELL